MRQSVPVSFFDPHIGRAETLPKQNPSTGKRKEGTMWSVRVADPSIKMDRSVTAVMYIDGHAEIVQYDQCILQKLLKY